jgi:hypothetical protein
MYSVEGIKKINGIKINQQQTGFLTYDGAKQFAIDHKWTSIRVVQN